MRKAMVVGLAGFIVIMIAVALLPEPRTPGQRRLWPASIIVAAVVAIVLVTVLSD